MWRPVSASQGRWRRSSGCGTAHRRSPESVLMQTSGQPPVGREKRHGGCGKEEEKGKRETIPTEPQFLFLVRDLSGQHWCLTTKRTALIHEVLSDCKTRGHFHLTVQSSVLDMSRCFDEHWSTRFLSCNDWRAQGRDGRGLAVFRIVEGRAPTQNWCYLCEQDRNALVAAVVVLEWAAPNARVQIMRGIRGAGVASFRQQCVS